jgi:hypothetical protein
VSKAFRLCSRMTTNDGKAASIVTNWPRGHLCIMRSVPNKLPIGSQSGASGACIQGAYSCRKIPVGRNNLASSSFASIRKTHMNQSQLDRVLFQIENKKEIKAEGSLV